MFSVITNIYNKKTKGPTLMELFSHKKTEKVFFFDNYRCPMCHPWFTHRKSLVVKKNFFSFSVTENNTIKVDPLVFLL